MNFDLSEILDGWPHEPGNMQVRKIVAADGNEKIQLRLDLGIIQMESSGRPDGRHPHGFESMLAYHQHRAEQARAAGNTYEISPGEAGELQQEGIQFYHRYISLFQLEDFEGVLRDTARNLDLFDFIAAHSDSDEVKGAFEQFRPYVMMMHARARGSLALQKGDHSAAIRIAEKACENLRELLEEGGAHGPAESSSELAFLRDWVKELHKKRPLDEREAIEKQLQEAIHSEEYEQAAKLRDALRALGPAVPDPITKSD